MWYIYTTGYYSVIKKNKILPFVSTRMDLEGKMLSEISQKERQILSDLTYMWNRKGKQKTKSNSQVQRTDWWLPEVGEGVQMGEGGEKVQTSNYKISPGDVMYRQDGNYS